MTSRHSWILAMLISIAAVGEFATSAPSQGAFSMKDVIKAWELRQERAQSARFYLDEEKVLAKGSQAGLASIIPNLSHPLPKEDLSFHVTQIVTFDGPKIRHSSEGEVSWDMKGEPFEQSNVMAFDGEKAKLY